MLSLSDEECAQIPEHHWKVFEQSDDYVKSYCYVQIGNEEVRLERKQYLAHDLLVKANQQEYNDSETKRWGDGKVVARVPLNVWFDQISQKDGEGDRDHLNWWLNKEENRPFRTFKGRV